MESYGISPEAATRYLMNIECFAYGIGAWVVFGWMVLPKESIVGMIRSACQAFMTAEQVGLEKENEG